MRMEGEAILLFTGSGNSVSIQRLFTCYYLWQAVSPKSRESVLAPYTKCRFGSQEPFATITWQQEG
jgi:hypothetical protein